jgi:hypothetical protein
VQVDSRNAILYVNKIGYFEFSRAYMIKDGSTQNLTIQLLEKNQVGTVQAASGGVINIPGGAKISFPANAVATKTGGAYTGIVQVYAQYLDPTDAKTTFNMPGDLRGINVAGKEQVLSTFGMLAVQLEDQSGQELQVSDGSSVDISMPLPANQAAACPTSIPLWHFDVANARWVEEGTAQKIGNEYVGSVKHFSFWNCDFPYDRINLEGKVFLGDLQHPLAGAEVWVGITGNGIGWGCGHGNTDDYGHFSGGVPKDETLELSVFIWGVCGGTAIYTQTIGPFSSDATLPPIIISNATQQSITVQGVLQDCNNQPVSNGYAKITLDNNSYVAFTDANGQFEKSFISCNSASSNGEAKGYDLNNLLESPAVVFTTPPTDINLSNIQVCTALQEYIQFTLDGQSNTLIGGRALTSPDSLMTNQFRTFIINENGQQFINFSFVHNNQAGTFPIDFMFVSPLQVNIASSALSTTVTTPAPNPGDFLVGTFGTSFLDVNGATHTISGNYRLRRD